VLTNTSNSTYNAGQFEVRKRTRNGFQSQANYTFSRALTNTFAQRASLDRVIDGWALSGFLAIYSGNPVGVFSARGTLNRGARSAQNTVGTPLTSSQLNDITGLFTRGAGPY